METELRLTDNVRASWRDWMVLTKDRCHLNFMLVGSDLSSHISAGMQSGLNAARRIERDLGDHEVRRALEVGCSVGFNCLGLSTVFASAEIVGLEPDREAVRVGTSMAESAGYGNVRFLPGFGEALPFGPGRFDLIVCHTVIEHVHDVEKVVAEMARVLAPGGHIHLEAPNYVWPYEPHLGVWCFPLLGKRFVRFLAGVQGKGRQTDYLAHLKFVHPRYLQKLFKANNLSWENRAEKKMIAVLSGQSHVVNSYHRAAKVLAILQVAGIGKLIAKILLGLKLYPSVLYTITKRMQ